MRVGERAIVYHTGGERAAVHLVVFPFAWAIVALWPLLILAAWRDADVPPDHRLRQLLAEGIIPNIARFVRDGFAVVADGSMRSTPFCMSPVFTSR